MHPYTNTFGRIRSGLIRTAALAAATALALPGIAHAQLNAKQFSLNRPVPAQQVQVLQFQPPFQAKPQQVGLDSFFDQPTVVVYMIPGNGAAEQAVQRLAKLGEGLKRVRVAVAMRAMRSDELEKGLDFLESNQIQLPVLIDNSMELAMGFKALKVPSFVMVDGNGVLKVRAIPSLDAKLATGDTLEETIRKVEQGGEVPVSDGELEEDTRTLIGQPVPTLKLDPAPFESGVEPFSVAPENIDRPTLMVVWMATCPHCQREMPRIGSWIEDNDGVRLVTVTRTDSAGIRQHTQRYLAAKDLEYMDVYSGDRQFFRDIKVGGIPTWLMIAPDGTVVDANIGEDEQVQEKLDAALAKANQRGQAKK